MSENEKAPLIINREGDGSPNNSQRQHQSTSGGGGVAAKISAIFTSRPYGEVASVSRAPGDVGLSGYGDERAPEPAVPTISTGTRTYIPGSPKYNKAGNEGGGIGDSNRSGAAFGGGLGSDNSSELTFNRKQPQGIANAWEAAARGSVSFFVPARRAAEIASLGIYSPLVDPQAAAQTAAARSHHVSGVDSTAASFVSTYSTGTNGGGVNVPAGARRRKVVVKGGGVDGEAVVVQQAATIVNDTAFDHNPAANTRMSFGAGAYSNNNSMAGGNPCTTTSSHVSNNPNVMVAPNGAQIVIRGQLPDTRYGQSTKKKVRRSHNAPSALDSTHASIAESGSINNDSVAVDVHDDGTNGSGGRSSSAHDEAAELGKTDRAFLSRYKDEEDHTLRGGGGGGGDHIGDGTRSHLGARSVHAETIFNIPGVEEHLLNALQATAIAGNDISSSCLYATGIVAGAAGKYGAISSALVCTVLFFFRGIYSEVFSALPMNGGTYSSLLNVASKNWAALAAVLSTLSYTATAVTSAASAADYLHYGFPDVPSLPVCIGVLCFFAVLTLMGMKDSANTAVFLFVVHLCCMFALIVASLVYCIKDKFSTLHHSWYSETPLAMPYSSWVPCLFYGYASALLGVTGFETSANYIEEQKPGVFPKTLNWMWVVITAINPALAILAMGVVPIEELVLNGNYSLAYVANHAVGSWFRTIIVLDSFLVLSGAVLTAYVGITGMHRRLALDRIMPNIFLWTNPWRQTNHVIILTFCALTVSLRLMVSDMDTLGGVYAIAFLSVMILFCVSNIMLKWKRSRLRRTPIVHPLVPIVAGLAIMAGLTGNVIKNPENAKFFSIYFVVFAAMVLGTKLRITILRFVSRLIPQSWRLTKFIRNSIAGIRNCPMVFFTNTTSLNTLNKVVQYVVENEDTNILKILHCFDCETVLEADPETGKEEVVCVDPKVQEFIDRLEYECSVIDRLYPKLTIELVFVNSPFSPLTVDEVSREMGIPKNYMFITCPGETFPHQIGQFGGIRVISH